MNRVVALSLSIIFQPLVIPTLISAVLMYLVPEATSIPNTAKWSLLLLICMSTFVVPLLSIVGMRLVASIDSFHVPDKRQRILPFSLVTVFYGITAWFFCFRINVDQLISATLILVTLCLGLLTAISFYWKISAHLMGTSGLLAVVVVLMIRYGSGGLIYFLIGCILACGAVGSARLALHAHKPNEIYGGFILGFTLCFGVYYYLLVL